MHLPYIKSLTTLFLILCWLVLAEYGLAGLSKLKNSLTGGNTAMAVTLPTQAKVPKGAVNKASFPFNSRPVSQQDYASRSHRLWVSSGSHAADKNGTDRQFSNLICEGLAEESCYLLNEARPGKRIAIRTDDNNTKDFSLQRLL